MYKTEAPYVRNAYVSPRTRDQLVPNLKSTEIISGDLNYNVRLPFLKARLTGFYTQINNQTWARSFYHDEYRTFVNYMMTNVDQLFMGIELGFESNITSTVQLKGLAEKVKDHNEKNGDKKGKRVTQRMLEAVFRRGIGAYNTNPQSVRPSVRSSDQWAYARVNAFLFAVRRGRFRGGKFDLDLLPSGHPLKSNSKKQYDIAAE